jgi:hypothetical protein
MVPVPWRAASRRGFPSRKAAPVTLPQLWLLDHDLQTDISVALERAWREAMPGNESATRNAVLRALHELLKPHPAVGRFIVVDRVTQPGASRRRWRARPAP